ncbi:MAG: response regulator [Thermoflexales bacterium]|nr:response regulator [Thermoflexales bacterium]
MAGELVLILDSSIESCDFMVEAILAPAGYAVLSAADAEIGLRSAQENSPDAVILSMQLPGLSGPDLLDKLRQGGRDLPVILVSTRRTETWVVEAFRRGARDLLVKPFEAHELLDALERALAGPRAQRERDEIIEQLNQARNQAERQLQELNALYNVGKTVTAYLDLEHVLAEIVDACVYLTRAEEGSLMLLDEASNELYLRAAKNLDQRAARGLRVRVDDNLLGRVVNTGRPVMLAGGDVHKIQTSYLVKSLLMVPLKAPPDRVIGVMGVTNKIANTPFSERDVFLLSALADYAGIAIENARLFTAIETERHKLEAALRGTEDAIVAVDHDKQVILCNPAGRRTFRFEASMIGCPIGEATSLQNLAELFDHLPPPGSPFVSEISLADGRTLQAQLSTVEDLGCVAVMRDISTLKELDRIKSEFVAMVSHDLRTPLTTIRGYVELLSRVGPLNDTQVDFVERIERSMVMIIDLITDLLNLGRIEAGLDQEKERCRLDLIIQRAVEDVNAALEEKKHSLHLTIEPGLPPLIGVPARLLQLVTNLLTNAIKYTPNGGQLAVRLCQERHFLMLTVSDNGIGIPAEDQAHIFDKFYRVNNKETESISGTGLGLSIVRTIAEKHGGRVWVESVLGQGSTFSVLLPTQPDASQNA